jgi:hypothetical protein
MGGDAASKIPDFSHYRSKQGSNSNLVFQYFMVGAMGALTAAGAKATVQGMWDELYPDMALEGLESLSMDGKWSKSFNWNIWLMFDVPQISWSTCPLPQTCSPWPKSRSTSPQSQKARMYVSNQLMGREDRALIETGPCQMAWQARFHPPPNSR